MLILAALFTVKAVIKSNNNKGLLQVEAINGYIACLKMTPTNGYNIEALRNIFENGVTNSKH